MIDYESNEKEEPRTLGLAMIPGRHIVSIYIDLSEPEAEEADSEETPCEPPSDPPSDPPSEQPCESQSEPPPGAVARKAQRDIL